MDDDRIICRCYRVNRREIVDAVRNDDLRTVEEVTAKTNAGGGCSSCYDDIRELLEMEHGGTHKARKVVPVRTDEETRAIVMQVVRDVIGPLFGLNGVQIQVLNVKGPRVEARLAGRIVGTTLPSILALKKAFVLALSDACGERMQLIEVNMLDRGIAEDPR